MKATINTPGVMKDSKTYPGAMVVEVEHKISSTDTIVRWTGPEIPPEEWRKILAFFNWCWSTTHSECQVRWFVNVHTRTWKAWAFPQEARTGMSARELVGPGFDKQRAQFDDGWEYFGTVHHHCIGGAFQSGTDENNEKNQQGLHITVGNMGSDHYDLDCRFYLNQVKFVPDMSVFWDIGEDLVQMLPFDLHHRVALHQMGIPSPTTPFPDEWKDNLIEVKTTVPSTILPSISANTDLERVGHGHWLLPGGQHRDKNKPGFSMEAVPGWRRAEMACDHIMEWAGNQGMDYRDLYDEVEWCHRQSFIHIVMKAASLYGADMGEIWRCLRMEEPTRYKVLHEKVIAEMKGKEEDDKKSRKKGKVKPHVDANPQDETWPRGHEYY